jgi:hypothetical protein
MDGQRLISVGNNEYRTQIESYTKIVRSGDRRNPNSFKVWMKSGDVYEYGMSDDAIDSLTFKGRRTWCGEKETR